MPTIDGARLLRDLHELRGFGRYKTGVHRPTFSPQDIEARRWLAGRMTEAGLDARIDGIGNVLGLSRKPGPKMLTGSHLESQNHAGWLDGCMGVIFGLEVARALQGDAEIGVDVAAWCDEEGHFGHFLGSRSFIGLVEEAEIDAARDRTHGKAMRAALAEAGLAGVARERIDPARYAGYFEAHIEQGATLEEDALRIGVVTAIVGIWQYRIRFEGMQNHAGTTRMRTRRDAGVALTKLCCRIAERFPEVCGPRSVWTTGRITLDPGAPSIIPGRAEMMFQFRDADPAVLATLEATLHALVDESNRAGPCHATVEKLGASTPAVMEERFQAALDRAAERHCPGAHLRMPSGAGHDAQYLARVLPAAMMFVPSIGGISHHWSEDTREDDLVLGCQVFATAIADLLRG